MEEDYYSILNIGKDASESEIKKAYYKLARENHPDKYPQEKREEMTQKFQKIGEAYEVLSDQEKRKMYDMGGKDALKGGMPSDFNPFEMFSNIFGQSFSQNNRNQQRQIGKNKETIFNLNVSLKEAYTGKKKKLKITKVVIVNKKDEKQINEKLEKTWNKCVKCNGMGAIMEMRQIAPGFMTQTQRSCDKCEGKAYVLLEDYKLKEITEIIEIQIPKGVRNETHMRIENQGNVVPGTYPGDLIILFLVNDKEKGFIRNGSNELIFEKKILLSEALCGSSFKLETLDERSLFISFKSVIIPGERKIIPKEGISGANLIIVFEIIFPSSLSKEQRKEIKQNLPLNKEIPTKNEKDISYSI